MKSFPAQHTSSRELWVSMSGNASSSGTGKPFVSRHLMFQIHKGDILYLAHATERPDRPDCQFFIILPLTHATLTRMSEKKSIQFDFHESDLYSYCETSGLGEIHVPEVVSISSLPDLGCVLLRPEVVVSLGEYLTSELDEACQSDSALILRLRHVKAFGHPGDPIRASTPGSPDPQSYLGSKIRKLCNSWINSKAADSLQPIVRWSSPFPEQPSSKPVLLECLLLAPTDLDEQSTFDKTLVWTQFQRSQVYQNDLFLSDAIEQSTKHCIDCFSKLVWPENVPLVNQSVIMFRAVRDITNCVIASANSEREISGEESVLWPLSDLETEFKDIDGKSHFGVYTHFILAGDPLPGMEMRFTYDKDNLNPYCQSLEEQEQED